MARLELALRGATRQEQRQADRRQRVADGGPGQLSHHARAP